MRKKIFTIVAKNRNRETTSFAGFAFMTPDIIRRLMQTRTYIYTHTQHELHYFSLSIHKREQSSIVCIEFQYMHFPFAVIIHFILHVILQNVCPLLACKVSFIFCIQGVVVDVYSFPFKNDDDDVDEHICCNHMHMVTPFFHSST